MNNSGRKLFETGICLTIFNYQSPFRFVILRAKSIMPSCKALQKNCSLIIRSGAARKA